MKEDVEAIWVMALDFLSDCEAIVALSRPRVTTHSAYYAMFHAARAVLVSIDGDRAATKHNGVARKFGQIAVADGPPEMLAAGRAINVAHEARIEADYELRQTPKSIDASERAADARAFLAACARHLGLPPPAPISPL
jgi:uncharacterized protein (UPF0332 family)